MSRASTEVGEGGLPPEVATALAPALRRALDSFVRREILRTLHLRECGLSVRGVAHELTHFTVSEIGYHLGVLEQAALVAGDEDAAVVERAFRLSRLGEELEVLAALRATDQWDRSRRRERGRRSARHLKMFRVPHPTRTIRLGDAEVDKQ